jgi:hypothetical protein
MNRWAAFLAQTPPTLQRLIAASQRVSLPRRCPPAERLARLRAALCRPAAVRAVYFALAPDEQQALQALRHLPRGLAADALAARLGPLRPLAAIRADRAPRTVSERLLLLGWLLPRPAARNHPARYLLPPELRAWLPQPLPPPAAHAGPPGPHTPPPPAVRAASAALLAAAVRPLPVRRDGGPTAAALRALRPRLAPLAAPDADALCRWLLPLLGDLGLIVAHGAAAAPGPGAARFLAAPLDERRRLLADAWVRAARPDPWLAPLRVSTRGLDWPALRRRLRAWAAALPADAPADHADSHALLHAALGPLADATTHGLRAAHRRTPWLPRRAAAVWAAACRGPLAWLGELPAPPPAAPDSPPQRERPPAPTDDAGSCVVAAPYGEHEAELLRLAPFARFVAADAAGASYAVTPGSLGAAVARGADPAELRAALLRARGALPDALAGALPPAGGLRMLAATVLLGDQPADLDAALRRPGARRAVQAQLAPGVALVAPGRAQALARALARGGRAVPPPPDAVVPPAADLAPGERAALLLAAGYYRAYAPASGPPGPDAALLARLRSGLPPAVAVAADAAVAALAGPPPATAAGARARPAAAADEAPPEPAALLDLLRASIRRRGAVSLRYQGAHEAAPCERVVRPLRLERHGPWWYLHAYCLLARAERCFRLDRVLGVGAAAAPPGGAGAPGAAEPPLQPQARRPRRPRGAPRSGFFAGPPDPPPGSALVRVWLDEGSDQPVGGLGGDPADAEDRDPLHGRGVEPVAAHTVGVEIDQTAQLAPDPGELGLVQQALEDAVLHPGAVALEQLHHLGAALVLDDIVADDGEHGALPAHAGV